MTKFFRVFFTVIILILITSCSTKKQILYINQDDDNLTYDYNYDQYKNKTR